MTLTQPALKASLSIQTWWETNLLHCIFTCGCFVLDQTGLRRLKTVLNRVIDCSLHSSWVPSSTEALLRRVCGLFVCVCVCVCMVKYNYHSPSDTLQTQPDVNHREECVHVCLTVCMCVSPWRLSVTIPGRNELYSQLGETLDRCVCVCVCVCVCDSHVSSLPALCFVYLSLWTDTSSTEPEPKLLVGRHS